MSNLITIIERIFIQNLFYRTVFLERTHSINFRATILTLEPILPATIIFVGGDHSIELVLLQVVPPVAWVRWVLWIVCFEAVVIVLIPAVSVSVSLIAAIATLIAIATLATIAGGISPFVTILDPFATSVATIFRTVATVSSVAAVALALAGVVAILVEFAGVLVRVIVAVEVLAKLTALEGGGDVLVLLGVHVIHVRVAILPAVGGDVLPSLCYVLNSRIANWPTVLSFSPFDTILRLRVLLRVDLVFDGCLRLERPLQALLVI